MEKTVWQGVKLIWNLPYSLMFVYNWSRVRCKLNVRYVGRQWQPALWHQTTTHFIQYWSDLCCENNIIILQCQSFNVHRLLWPAAVVYPLSGSDQVKHNSFSLCSSKTASVKLITTKWATHKEQSHSEIFARLTRSIGDSANDATNPVSAPATKYSGLFSRLPMRCGPLKMVENYNKQTTELPQKLLNTHQCLLTAAWL